LPQQAVPLPWLLHSAGPMTAHSGIKGPAAGLTGRLSERRVLDRFVAGVRAGEGRALVVRGEPGVGKTVLLDYLAGRASGCRVARAAGVQSEMELAFAALHQLCAPMLDHAESLPDPQREALRTAFGLSAGPVPDRFRVGLAVLGLLSEAAGERPLVCIVDDQQWLDRASAQALGFAARRLAADPVGLVFAARVPGEDVAGLPELVVDGLADDDARELLESVLTGLTGPLDAQVRDRIVADTHGNPLALLELPRGLTPAQLTGGFGRSSAVPLAGRIEESFGRQLEALPAQTRRLVQLAAADPTGDPVLVWRAAGRLAIGAGAAGPAGEAGLVEFGARVRFRHPLVRSAAYRSASVQTRQELHGALAEATDAAADPDRRAWHRAQAAPGPDEEVAAELERSAGRAQRRGGLAAAAAFLERSAGLTLDPARRAQRALAAAQAKHKAGALDAALGLLAMAQAGPLDELQRARGDLLRAQIAFASSHGRDAPPLMLSAAKQLEALDVGLARETYLEAFTAALFVGRLSPAVGDVARAARMAPAPQGPARAPDLLLDGLALLVTEGYAAGTPALRRALLTFRSQDIPAEEGLSWLWLAERAAMAVWDDEAWHILASRHLKLARDAGALSELPLAVRSRILVHTHAGELQQGAALIAEAQAVVDATGSQLGRYGVMGIAAFRGHEAEATELIQATMDGVTSRGEGRGVTSGYAAALLYNGLGHYDKALAAAGLVVEYDDIGVLGWSLTELVEAAVRSGQPARASVALQRLTETTRASGTDWALGTEARSRALLSEGETAENCYREAIERLGRTRMRPAVARAHLLYGEWLRRQNRRRDARAELRAAHGLFTTMGIEAFAERARRELLATGDTVRKRTVETASELTAQEAHIARLAVDGRTNVEIGAQLFLSTRTVEWHLSKVYTKLGVGSRRELRRSLASLGQADPQA
jgi:DNA-binding CsgD family transcriptional regulator/tetratricopeptide (TPR) repeat protein